MDRVTHSVRAFYEAYPYPPGDRVDCDGYQVELLLSYLERPSAHGRPLQVLEAGCGRGVNLLAAAAAQPGVRFLGIDISRVAIEEASRTAQEQGLANLSFQVADLMTPETLPSVSGGYDLLLSYGVLHHLSDPAGGLSQLKRLLSPQGAIAFMVDGLFGRQPLDRFLQVLSLLSNDSTSEQEKEARARALARVAEQGLFAATHWQGTSEADPVEFADRCLHVHEQSFTIDTLWGLLSSSGLSFLRWLEPADWDSALLAAEPALAEVMDGLDAVDRYRLVERLCERPKLTLVAVPNGVRPRAELTIGSLNETVFRMNPQLKSQQQDTHQLWQLRHQPPEALNDPLAETLLMHAQEAAGDFSAGSITESLMQEGYQASEAGECLLRLEGAEWLYRPHRGATGEGK